MGTADFNYNDLLEVKSNEIELRLSLGMLLPLLPLPLNLLLWFVKITSKIIFLDKWILGYAF